MIRYISSFTISLLLHTFLAIILFYSYTNINMPSIKKEKKVNICLSCVVDNKPKITPIEKTISPKVNPLGKPKKKKNIQKEIPPKKISPKVNPLGKKIKKVVPKKVIEKKVQTKKTVPIKKVPIIKKERREIEPIIEEKIKSTDEVPKEEIKTTSVESEFEKEKKLQTQYIDNNIAKIIKLLKENLYYPRSARKRGIVGEVIVEFKLSIDSTVRSINIISSQSEILSRAAIQTIENLSGTFPKPSEELSLQLPIKYSLKK